MPRKIAAGNWKMNGLSAQAIEVSTLSAHMTARGTDIDVLICPPATLISTLAGSSTSIKIGAQTCHTARSGAHTGDLSAEMLADAGASHVILGHSERRTDHGETSTTVAAQVRAAWAAQLTVVVCIGETLAQREAEQSETIVLAQLTESLPDGVTAKNTIVAYEPVWAIGTGLTATPEQIGAMHAAIRQALSARFADGDEISLLYGGSVKAANAADIFAVADVNGALVGGASLKAAEFAPIIDALATA